MCLSQPTAPAPKPAPTPPPPPLPAPEGIEVGEAARQVQQISRRRRGTRSLRIGLGIPGGDNVGTGLKIPAV